MDLLHSALDRPPKPRLVFRVGITGHRHLTNAEGVANSIRTLLERIEHSVLQVHATSKDYYAESVPELRIISPLAEGADTIAAEAGIARKWVLHVPLPFVREEYAKDFNTPESYAKYEHLLGKAASVLELDGQRSDKYGLAESNPDIAYVRVGHVVLSHSDLLLAVWDGMKPHGLGGTADIVQEAHNRGIPVIRIDAAKPDELSWSSPTNTFPPGNVLDRLDEELRSQISLAGLNKQSQSELKIYLSQKQPHHKGLGLLWPIFHDFVCTFRLQIPHRRSVPFEERVADNWKDYRAELLKLAPRLEADILSPIQSVYAWADGLAVYYADLYRSAFVLNYLLGALAVIVALLGYLFHGGKEFWAPLEFLILLVIIVNTWLAAVDESHSKGTLHFKNGLFAKRLKQRLSIFTAYHDRFRNYRQLAEQLRLLRDMALVPVPLRTAGGSLIFQSSKPGSEWTRQLFRTYARTIPLPDQRLDSQRVQSLADLFLRYQIGITPDGKETNQVKYHRDNCLLLNRMERRLKGTGSALFIATTMLCAALIVLVWTNGPEIQEEWPVRAITFLCAILPAVAAAMYGIRSQGDFARLSERSDSMVNVLNEIGRQLAPLAKGTRDNAANAATLFEIETKTAELILQEITDWQIAIAVKHLELP